MKRLAIILAVIIAVAAIAVAAAPFVIPSEFLKQRVAERIAALTGRTVTLSGATTLSIYPHVAIGVDGLAIANPDGMGDDAVIQAPRLDTRLRLLPLLFGRVEFDEFQLTNPVIHLVVDNEGRRNWTLAGSAVAARAMATPPRSNDPLAIALDLQVGHLIVSNGTLLYDNLASDTREQMTEVDLDIDWPSVSATASGRGKMMWRGEPMEFTGLIAAPLQLMRGGTSAARFALASTPLRASFSGRATDNDGTIHLDGDGSVSTPSMRRTIEWLGTPMGTGPILGAASVRGTVAIAGPSIDFTAASLELDGNSAEGSLGVSFAGVRPAIAGRLTTQRLDLSAYAEAIRADLLTTGSWLIAPARMPFAEAVDAEVSFTMGQVTMGATEIGDTWATVSIKDGNVDAQLQGANFYAGQIGAHLRMASAGGVLSADAHLDIKGVPATPALANLAGVTALDGNVTGALDLNASGRGWGEFVNSVAGKGRLAIGEGKLSGVDLAAVADQLDNPFAGPIVAGRGETRFRQVDADFAVASGALSTSNLFMEGDDFRLALSGQGSLLSGATEARATLTNATETIPLSIAGTWRQPAIARASLRPAPETPAAPGGG
ncbi:MAG: AsmA family protein [Bauldia sp.]